MTAEPAKPVAAACNGMRPSKSYHNGCSTGGRQGMQFAQRFQEDFAGIVAGTPALNSTAGRLRAITNAKALAVAPIPEAKLALLAARDGLKDRLIDDPRRCDFKPSRDLPACGLNNNSGCFTPAELKTLEALYGSVVLAGERRAPGYMPGAEAVGPNGRSGWLGWIIGEGGALGQSPRMTLSALRYMLFPKPMSDYDFSQFDFERDTPRIEKAARMMSALDPDLSRFQARGGQLLMYFGWADPALNPLLAIDYYEKVVGLSGRDRTREFFRLFMLPGVFHCSGGVGPA